MLQIEYEALSAKYDLDNLFMYKDIIILIKLVLVILFSKEICIPQNKARIQFCHFFILPHLDYCNTICGNANIDKLCKLHKRAACMIYNMRTAS